MKAIEFANVHFSYKDGNDDVFSSNSFCLNNVNFSVEEGEFVAVLGHNGSGKSTLARLTNGLLSPTSGKITVFGLDAKAEENLFEIRKQVGIVFQNPDNQMVASIVEDDIAFGPENVGVPREEIEQRITFALHAVGMQAYRHSTPSRLSGGQKQRIAIAGVLALKPRVMILDESTAMLDPRGRKEVMDVIVRLNKEENITVLLITHYPEEALLADRAIVMNHGEIVMEGKPQEIFRHKEELEKYTLKLPRSIRVCRELSQNGLAVMDSLTAEDLAENVFKALQTFDGAIPEKYNLEGAGTSRTQNNKMKSEGNDECGRIVCKDLNYVYNPDSPFETYALKNAEMTIESGAFFGILGHTGSGKSTFVQHLNALLKLPTAEKKYKPKKKSPPPTTILRVNGYDLTDKNTDFKALRSKVGMVFQYPEYQLFAESVYEDVEFGLKNFAGEMTDAEREQAVKDAIETVGLCYAEVKNKSPFDLSGGQKRRVGIAGVIVTKPEILVLDEPAAGLDPLGKEEIHKLLHKIHNDWCKTVIIVSHDMDEIVENCTEAAVFSEGKVLAVGTPKDIFFDEKIIETAGLEQPLIAKTLNLLRKKGINISCELSVTDFVEKVLDFTKTQGAGMRLTKEGGVENA